MINEVFFLTSNAKKAQDFSKYGVGIKEFHVEIPEVLSPDVEVVVLHKARDTKLNKIIVEDTSLEVENADFYGTQIKHVYDEVKEDMSFHGKKAVWKVSICMRVDDKYYISTGVLEGILKYPALDFGYHFDRIFAVEKDNDYQQFELFTDEEKLEIGPRFKAVAQLVNAMKTNDFSSLKEVNEQDIQDWTSQYQVETVKKKHKIA
jgi:inosine/xanthosine triphosphate pyrophosphatase family protein